MKSYIHAILISFLLSGFIHAEPIGNKFFDEVDAFVKANVSHGLVNYSALKDNATLQRLINDIGGAELTNAPSSTRKAFYINAYNLHVINQAAQSYPIVSVQNIPRFFDGQKIVVANEQTTLNRLEKEHLLSEYNDARLHFVLVCGALGCPPITSFAYRPELLEQQLEQQTKLALNDQNFLRSTDDQVSLSQIFKWYLDDFGGTKKSVFEFINKYLTNPILPTSSLGYYPYDWSLNDAARSDIGTASQGNNASRYIVSSTIPKGSVELKIFNNLYTQVTGSDGSLSDRSTFFTTSLSALYGVSSRLNVGFITRYRRVRNDRLPSSAFDIFSQNEAVSSRNGITAFGPQIRYAPVEKWANFSIQSSIAFPIGQSLSGSGDLPYIDWDGITWNTQFFNDISIGANFSLFTEIDLLVEDIGKVEEGHANRFSTPATVIFSYNPNRKTTLYALGSFSPYWQTSFDYFVQGGLGAKYQFSPKFELELLVTDFTNKFLAQSGGRASTSNIGIRINI